MKKILCVLALAIFVASNAYAAPAASGSASGAVGLSVTALAAPTEGDKPLKVTTGGELGAYSELSLSLQEGYTLVGLGTSKGGATTQIAVTDIGGDVWRYTWTGTGTDPVFGCQPGETPAGTLLNIQAQNLDAGDNGVFTVTSCGNDAVDGHDWFQVTNPSGVASTGTIGGEGYYIEVDLAAASPLDTNLASTSSAYDTVAAAKAVKERIQYKALGFDPKAVCDGDANRVFLMDSYGDQGIIVTKWKFECEANPTTELDIDLMRADDWVSVANSAVMNICDTTAGASAETTTANINGGAAVAAGKILYMNFGTAYTEAGHNCTMRVWYYEVGS